MNIALIEFSSSHDECLYSQIKFIKSKADTKLIYVCNETIKNRTSYENYIDDNYIIPEKIKLKDLIKLRKHLLKHNIEKIIINTAQGNVVRNFVLLPWKRNIEFIGVHHNFEKFIKSFSQKIISFRIKKYFALNEYILKNMNHDVISKYKFGVFYPIYFQEFNKVNILKDENEIWICIPGAVQSHRRDYMLLLEYLKNNSIATNIKFIFLGKCNKNTEYGKLISDYINTNNLNNSIKIWYDFVDIDEFYTYLSMSDFIMP